MLDQLEMRQERQEVEEERREAGRQPKILEYNRCSMEIHRLLKQMPARAEEEAVIPAYLAACASWTRLAIVYGSQEDLPSIRTAIYTDGNQYKGGAV